MTIIVNPDPRGTTLTSLDPPQAVTGGPSFTLTAIGSRFTAQSSIVWNLTPMPTTFVDSTKLTTTISAALIATDGNAAVSVQTPGLTVSGTIRMAIVSASPTVTSISPASVPAGSAPITLTVNGSGFIPASKVVTVPDQPLTTTYVSFTQLTATVPASVLATPGAYDVRVTSPGGYISPLPFTFTVKASTPAGPTIGSLSPSSAPVGGAAFPLTVAGTGFTANSKVQWNSTALATTFTSATQLTAAVTADLIATAAASVTVVDGGTSMQSLLRSPP